MNNNTTQPQVEPGGLYLSPAQANELRAAVSAMREHASQLRASLSERGDAEREAASAEQLEVSLGQAGEALRG